jgi:plastocyanin
MIHRFWPQLGLGVTFAVALTALVLALRGGETPLSSAAGKPAGETSSVVVADFQPKGHTIAISEFRYDPDPVRVKAGQAVVWENYDEVPHTVTARGGSWDSGTLVQGEAVVIVFDEPGTYEYICALHPPAVAFFGVPDGTPLVGGGGHGMQGTIIVE